MYIFNAHPLRPLQFTRSKIPDRPNPQRAELIANFLCRTARRADNPHVNLMLFDIGVKVEHAADCYALHLLANQIRFDIKNGVHTEAFGAKAFVEQQCPANVARTNDRTAVGLILSLIHI